MLHEVFQKFDRVITVEDGCLQGGMGSAVLEFMIDNGYNAKVKRLGIPDQFIPHGNNENLYELAGYGINAIVTAIESTH
jgi:1-deoxy-D-xylulose-5-phosphate synthase